MNFVLNLYNFITRIEMYEEFSNPLEILAWDGSLLDNVYAYRRVISNHCYSVLSFEKS